MSESLVLILIYVNIFLFILKFILMLRGNVPQIEEQDEEEYRQRFLRAVQMFQHQIVVDVVEKRLVPVSAVDVGVVPFADEYFGDELGMEVAKGNVDLNTMRAVDDFDPSAAENFVSSFNFEI